MRNTKKLPKKQKLPLIWFFSKFLKILMHDKTFNHKSFRKEILVVAWVYILIITDCVKPVLCNPYRIN